VDPFAEEFVDPERPDLRVDPDARHLGRGEAADESYPVGTERLELRRQLSRGTEVVAARLGDGGRVPRLEVGRDVRPVGRQDPPDATGEATALGLDQMTDALVGAPLAWLGPPATVVAERPQLGDDDRGRRGEQVGDARRGQGGRFGHVGLRCHGTVSAT
jgi:hypothetical protein